MWQSNLVKLETSPIRVGGRAIASSCDAIFI